jgi:hypothetical protein
VHNVAVHVMGRDFWVFELEAKRAEGEVVEVVAEESGAPGGPTL